MVRKIQINRRDGVIPICMRNEVVGIKVFFILSRSQKSILLNEGTRDPALYNT